MKRSTTILLFATLCLFIACLALAQNVEYVGSTLWNNVSDVKVAGDYAYCAFANGLVILDVSDPADPVFVGQLYCQGTGEGIDIAGNYTYLADGSAGLLIIDIADPSNPTLAGNYDTPFWAHDVFVFDNQHPLLRHVLLR